jgi:hypothetical protein
LQLDGLNVVFALLHAIQSIGNHCLHQVPLFHVFNFVKNMNAVGALGSAVPINVFGGKGLTATTQYHSAILGGPVVSIRVVSNVVVISHQISISFEVSHATPNNKLDH